MIEVKKELDESKKKREKMAENTKEWKKNEKKREMVIGTMEWDEREKRGEKEGYV